MNCPNCLMPMKATEDLSGKHPREIWLCLHRGIDLNRFEEQADPQQADPGKQSRKLVLTEKEVEAEIDLLCVREGWEYLSTVHKLAFITIYCPSCVRRRQYTVVEAHCPECYSNFTKCRAVGKDAGYHASQGIPDRLIAPPFLPPWLWVGVEEKGTKTDLSEAQRRLADRNRIAVARSANDVIETMDALRQILKAK